MKDRYIDLNQSPNSNLNREQRAAAQPVLREHPFDWDVYICFYAEGGVTLDGTFDAGDLLRIAEALKQIEKAREK